MTRLFTLAVVLVLSLALSGCAELIASGLGIAVGVVGVGQRVVDHRIQQEKNERLKALEAQLKIQNERLFRLCEQVKRQRTPADLEC